MFPRKYSTRPRSSESEYVQRQGSCYCLILFYYVVYITGKSYVVDLKKERKFEKKMTKKLFDKSRSVIDPTSTKSTKLTDDLLQKSRHFESKCLPPKRSIFLKILLPRDQVTLEWTRENSKNYILIDLARIDYKVKYFKNDFRITFFSKAKIFNFCFIIIPIP